ncbi:hypothetical protein DTO207G8_2415 [Paecilomyces variotii]|nr:hypothetical protein DTO207G8_2415 [Paecilomyces variotii]
MELDISYSLDNAQQFWDELEEIVSAQCDSEGLIDSALRTYLSFTTRYKDEYLTSDYDILRCSYKLFSSSIFAAHADYVRRQIVYCLLQEDDLNTLHLIVSFLLFDGRQNEVTFQMMNDEGSFPRLVELIQLPRKDENVEPGLHRLLMDLFYEMSRIQRVKVEDLVQVDDDFVRYLFEIIEELSYDANDPYHYPVIRVVLILNEQFMVSEHDPTVESAIAHRLTNRVIKVLSMHGYAYKTFGENIILLLNREDETSLQLLTLKLLYLIFTTPPTYEYFYTNDLRVLVDILIRNLLDLPEEAAALRHTYLRVLYPLLAHTQLRYPPYYKREEVRRMLSILVPQGDEADPERILHFNDVDDTTKRLVARCSKVEWLQDPEPEPEPQLTESPTAVSSDTHRPSFVEQSPETVVGEQLEATTSVVSTNTDLSSTANSSPTRPVERTSSDTSSIAGFKLGVPSGPYLEASRSSSLSAVEVAMHQEQPGVITPSVKDALTGGSLAAQGASLKPKIKPEPPMARRSRGRRPRDENDSGCRTPGGVDLSGYELRKPSIGEHNATPLPPPARRSASHPPPAVPPPRRSSHSVHPHTPTSSNGSLPIVAGMAVSPHRHGQKPEPPKTRRSGRAKHLQPEMPVEEPKPELESKDPIVIISTQSGEVQESPVSIEEVMQKHHSLITTRKAALVAYTSPIRQPAVIRGPPIGPHGRITMVALLPATDINQFVQTLRLGVAGDVFNTL